MVTYDTDGKVYFGDINAGRLRVVYSVPNPDQVLALPFFLMLPAAPYQSFQNCSTADAFPVVLPSKGMASGEVFADLT